MNTRARSHRICLAAGVSLGLVLFAGCVHSLPWSRHRAACGTLIGDMPGCDTPVPCDAPQPNASCDSHANGGSTGCEAGGCNGWCHWSHDGYCYRLGHPVLRLVGWPFHCCCQIINFCAPDDFTGPSVGPCPGRFHPVPTHPVFAPPAELPAP